MTDSIVSEISNDFSLETPDGLIFLYELFGQYDALYQAVSVADISDVEHAEFQELNEVSGVVHEIKKELIRLADESDGLLAEYYISLSEHFPQITEPDSECEIIYGELIAGADNLPILLPRIALALHDYNYVHKGNPELRDPVFAIGYIIKKDQVPETLVNFLRDFFNVANMPECFLVREHISLLGGSQATREHNTKVRPSGSSHIMIQKYGGDRIVIRQYINFVSEKVFEAVDCAKCFFGFDFSKSIGIDLDADLQIYKIFSDGQYWNLLMHEVAEAVGTYKFSGADRAMQECLYTTSGYLGLLKLNDSGGFRLNAEDINSARLYLLSKIMVSLSSDSESVYSSGYALMLKQLIEKGAIQINGMNWIESVDWNTFDKVMETISDELLGRLSVSPNPPVGENIDGLHDEVREWPLSKAVRLRIAPISC